MQSTVRKSAYNFIQHYTTIPALCKHLFFARTNLSHFDQKITHSLTTLHKHLGRALYVRLKRYAISAGERNSPLQNAAANRSGRTGRRGRRPLHHVSVNCFVRCGRPKGAPTGYRVRTMFHIKAPHYRLVFPFFGIACCTQGCERELRSGERKKLEQKSSRVPLRAVSSSPK